MWSWLHKNIVKQYRIPLYAASASLGAHVLFFALFFFVHTDRGSHISFTVAPHDVVYTVMPLGPSRSTTGIKNTGAKRSSLIKQSSSKKAASVKKPQTMMQQPKKAVEKKVSKKAEKKKVEPKKKDLSAAEAKKKEPDKELVKEKEPEPEAKPQEQKPIEAEKGPESEHDEQLAQPAHEFSLSDMGLYEEYVMLQETIGSTWAPPPGIQQGAACKITFVVDWQGIITDMTIDESSGVITYDVSARSALEAITMPRWTWGKKLTITFN